MAGSPVGVLRGGGYHCDILGLDLMVLGDRFRFRDPGWRRSKHGCGRPAPESSPAAFWIML